MRIKLINNIPSNKQFDLLIVLVNKIQVKSGQFADFLKNIFPKLDYALIKQDFEGNYLQQLFIYTGNNLKIRRMLLVGLGDEEGADCDYLRTAAYHASKKAEEVNVKSVLLHYFPEKELSDQNIKSLFEGLYLQNYSYSLKKNKKDRPEINYHVHTGNKDHMDIESNIQHRMQGMKLARDYANEPSNILTPAIFANKIRNEFENSKSLKVDIFDKKILRELHFNALLSVAQGSKEKPYLIKIHYSPKMKSAPKIVLIGKGITFDSGGISIKPALNMEEMKYDMAGAAAVAGIMKYISLAKPQAEIIGMIPAVENMPGGSAVKPGDIVKAYNGKTVEIINTDAEGRLILADTLAYACDKFHPDLIIDLATLTGAVMVALGDKMAGMFTSDEQMADVLRKAGNRSDELVWPLPLSDLYKKQLESNTADIKNVGARWGGAAAAALFLQEFVENTRWVHLDIAGVANDVKDRDYFPHGATGFGVRLLAEALSDLIENLNKSN